ncbi:MAG: hypothetical protein ACP5EP_06075 [Acidobacteriaceae bacterium]
MWSMHLELYSPWLQRAEAFLPLVAGLLSLAILLGCAITSWLCPSEDDDCLFHRTVC